MHLYLSSFKLGNRSGDISELVRGGKRIGVIRNALDFSTDIARLESGRLEELAALELLGLNPEAVDLRDYFKHPSSLESKFEQLDGLWVVGGNSFILRRAFYQSGLDLLLKERIGDKDFFYGGYSAGICVMTPTLEGIHLADEPDIIPEQYMPEQVWEGLGFLPYSIAPHYRSDHPEAQIIERTVEYFITHKIPFIALQDGEVIVQELRTLPNLEFQIGRGSVP